MLASGGGSSREEGQARQSRDPLVDIANFRLRGPWHPNVGLIGSCFSFQDGRYEMEQSV